MRKTRRRAVRPAFIYLLLCVVLLTGILCLLPSPPERMHRRWLRLEEDYAQRGCSALKTEAQRQEFLDFLGELQRHGAIRPLKSLAELAAQCEAFPPAQGRTLVHTLFYDLLTWNTRFPQWKLAALERYRKDLGPAQSPEEDLEALYRKAPVELTFKSPLGHERLWLQGDWDQQGELDSLGGWRNEPLARGPDGTWTIRELLTKNIANNWYHAVVRTKPWPQGTAVGYAAFRVDGPMTARIAPLAAGAPEDADDKAPVTPSISVAAVLIDGATWRVILPLVYTGRLPHFRRLLEEGAVADLTSTMAPFYGSPPNIYTGVTGKLYFRHGREAEDYFRLTGRPLTSPLWKIVSDQGRSSLTVNMIETFPPEEKAGEVVSDAFFALNISRQKGVKELALSPSVRAFAGRFGVTGGSIRSALRLLGWIDGTMSTTSPSSLEDELRPLLPPFVEFADIAALARYMDDCALAVSDYLTAGGRHFDLACLYVLAVDNASHVLWGGFEPPSVSFTKSVGDQRVREAISQFPPQEDRLIQAYQNADRLVGLMMRRARHVVVFSDHGFGSCGIGYLALKFQIESFLSDFDKTAHMTLPASAELSLGNEDLSGPKEYWLWLPKSAESRDYAARLADHLKQARYLPQDSAMFSSIEIGEKSGKLRLHFVQEQPTPIYINGVRVEGVRHSVMDFFHPSTLQGVHNGNGILALWGPKVRKTRLEDAYIPDVTPTILYLLGLPVARDMDGRVLTQALGDGELEARPIQTVESYGMSGNLWLRLFHSIRWRRLAARLAARLSV